MYKDVISYKLGKNITEEHMLKVAADIIKNWMNSQPGFIKWDINKNSVGGYTDIVYWETEDDAKNAEAEMVNIPNASEWYSCYENDSISSQNLTQIASFS